VRQGLTLPRDLADALRRHAEAAAPREACGLLGAIPGSAVATTFRPARNVAEVAYLYRMDPGEVVRLVDQMTAAGEGLLAIVHSHTSSPATPSPTDRREAAWPDAIHVIVSLDDRVPEPERIRAWRIRDAAAEEVSLDLG
jgi:proteasome lid subunit RPN8/RPN11